MSESKEPQLPVPAPTSQLPVKVPKEVRTTKSTGTAVGFGAFGVALGVGATLLIVGLQRPTSSRVLIEESSSRPQAVFSGPVGTQSIDPSSPMEIPSVVEEDPSLTEGESGSASPMNPFAGGMLLPEAPPALKAGTPWKGMVLPRDLPAELDEMLPIPEAGSGVRAPNGRMAGRRGGYPASELDTIIARGLPTPPPALKPEAALRTGSKEKTGTNPTSESSTLVNIRGAVANRERAADELVSTANKLGGKAQVISERGDGDLPMIKGVVATVPKTAVDELVKQAYASGAIADKETWTGSPTERTRKLAEDAETRIATLKKLREALLVTYLDDAQPVKEVDAEIAAATKGLEQLRAEKPNEGMTVVRITFVGKA